MWHYHAEFEVTLLQGSRGSRIIGDRIAPIGRRDLLLIAPNLPHVWKQEPVGQEVHAIGVHFTPDFLGSSSLEKPEFSGIVQLLARAQRGIRFLDATCDRIIEKLADMRTQSAVGRIAGLLSILELMADSSDYELMTSPHFAPRLDPASRDRMNRASRYILDHFTEPLTLSDVSAVVHMCPDAFCRYFKKATGVNFMDAVNRTRADHAARLLVETDLSVAEICYASGFASLTSFNRWFRWVKNASPTEYRDDFRSQIVRQFDEAKK